MRNGAKQGFLKFILLGFMALAVGGLVLTDVGGFFRGGLSSNVVAKGNNIEIGLSEFDRTLRRILANQGMGPQEAYEAGLINQALRGEIQNRILAREASKIGIRPNDETLVKQIATLTDSMPTNGGSKRDALVQILRSQGISEGEFIGTVRQELSVDLLQNALASNLQEIPLAQAKAIYQFQNEKRDFEGFVLTNASVKDVTAPTEENLKKFYEARKINYAIPETRDITIATLTKEMVADNIEIDDAEIREAYDSNIDSYKKPEQRLLQQAILKDQKTAQDVLAAIKDEKTLENAVLKITENTTAYIGENKFSKTSMTDEIAKPAFNAEKDAAIGPIQTPLGWHVLVVKEITPPKTTSFDDVKADIKDQILQDRLMDDLIDASNNLDDQLAGGEDLSAIVQEMGLTTQSYSGINQAGMKGEKDALQTYQGDKAQILENAFDFDEGEVSPVLEMADGRYIAIRIDSVKPLSYTAYEDVRQDLEKEWLTQQRALANKQRAEDIYQSLLKTDDMIAVNKDYDISIKEYKNLIRTDAEKSKLSFVTLRQIYDAEQGKFVRIQTPEGYLIGQVTDISLPDTDTESAQKEIEAVQQQNNAYLAQEVLGQYMINLLDKYKVRINDDLLRQVYAQPPSQ